MLFQGPVPWLLTAELFRQSARPAASAIGSGFNWTFNFALALVFPFMQVLCRPIITVFSNWLLRVDRPLAQSLSARYRCGRSGVRFPGRSNRHSVANDSPPLRRFFGAVLCCPGAKPRRWAPQLVTRFGVIRRV